MHHIVIDARTINSSNNKFIGQFLDQLQIINKTNKYTILIRPKDKDYWKPTADKFSTEIIDINGCFFIEQFKLKKLLNKLSPDLVHFYTSKQPISYKGRHVTTLYNLIDIPSLSPIKLSYFRQFINKYIFEKIIQTNEYIIVSSSLIKKELLKSINIPEATVAIIPYEISTSSNTAQDFWHQVAQQTYSVYIDAIRDHIKL